MATPDRRSARPRRKKRRWTAWFWGFGPPLTPEERQRALQAPGPSWSQYFFRDFLRWWAGLGFLVVDVILVTSFLRPVDLLPMLLALAAALYLEFLLYEYLWHVPDPERIPTRPESPWHRAFHPVAAGRWTEGRRPLRDGAPPPAPGSGPDPTDFL